MREITNAVNAQKGFDGEVVAASDAITFAANLEISSFVLEMT